MRKKVVFKTYSQDQMSLLPPSYNDLVPEHHSVRIVNTIIDNVDISSLEKKVKIFSQIISHSGNIITNNHLLTIRV